MTAILSPHSSSGDMAGYGSKIGSPSSQTAQSSQSASPPSVNPNHPPLHPLITSTSKRTTHPRPSSHAKKRLSGFSNISNPSQNPSRPTSHVHPLLHSSLVYTTVRDFAYPALHPLHYGPPPEPSGAASGVSTPISESQRRISDPALTSWDGPAGGWFAGPWGGDGSMAGEQATSLGLQDGPPWSEDEDLHSPVVTSSRQNPKHKRYKSSLEPYSGEQGRSMRRNADMMAPQNFDSERGYFAGTRADGSELYYVGEDDAAADGPGGEYVTYPPDPSRASTLAPYNVPGQRDSHFAATLPNRSYVNHSAKGSRSYDREGFPEALSSPDNGEDDDSRYSRDYQFTIASPDEEMHGKAVALFDFMRENENELPLVEGQVIWVSYRHGQGWLVAEDPKTHESGLVPEEYVRLLRDIQGGLGSLKGDSQEGLLSPVSGAPETITPTEDDLQQTAQSPDVSNGSNGSNGLHRPPIVSTFSTSSRDLDPFPPHLLGTQHGQAPPQVIHYHGQPGGSQGTTPTLTSPRNTWLLRRSSSNSRSHLGDSTNRPCSGDEDEAEDDEDNEDNDNSPSSKEEGKAGESR
ncbi:MAG: HOG (high osmolarity glycerol) pathway protein [Sclerophora amabilis]|nr:MAG: HOG (high osmolarity glycerol) pathway protein [Sclerophora amabilis]